MIFEVSHKTFYQYSAPVVQSHHVIHLAPRVMSGSAFFAIAC